MGLKNLISTALIGLLYLKGVQCTCSSIYTNLPENKVATMCKKSSVQGINGDDVYIDTDLGATAILGQPGTVCSCKIETQRGKRLLVQTLFSGPHNSDCGTVVEYSGRAFGSTQLGVRCYSYQFEAETHTYTDMLVSLRKEKESYQSASSPYCVRLSLKFCDDDQHQCGDGTCIPATHRCDHEPHCNDESDEIGCSSLTCVEGLVACDNNAKCINGTDRCDGVYQCPDQSDELPKYCNPGSVDYDSSGGESAGLPPANVTVSCSESPFLPEPTTASTTTPETTSTTTTTTTPSTTSSTTSTTPVTTTTTTTPTTTTTTPSTTSSATTTTPITSTTTPTTTPSTTTTVPTTITTTTTSPTTTTSTTTPTTSSTTPSTTSSTSTTPSTSTSSSSSTTTTTTPTPSTTKSTTQTTTTPTSTSTTTSTTTTIPASTTVTTPTKTTPTSTTTTAATPTKTTPPSTSTTSQTETPPPTTRSSTTSTTTSTTESTSTFTTFTSTSTKTSKATSPTTTTPTTAKPTTATSIDSTPTSTTTPQPTTRQTTTLAPRCDVNSQFECGNGSCIPLKWRCDSLEDCNDKSDEAGCSSFVCGENMFLCDERRTCIKSTERCDGKYQCPDLSDELPKYCGSPSKAPITEEDDSTKTAIIIGIICGALFLIMTSGCIVYWVKTRNWNRRADRYAMSQQSEKSESPYSAYSAPTLHIVPTTKETPTHIWYPSTSGKDQLSDLYVVEQIDGSAGDKHLILPQ